MKLNQRTDATAPEPLKCKRGVAGNFPKKLSPALLLLRARKLLGVSRQVMAAQMGIPQPMLSKFEYGKLRMPNSFLIKIFMFGLDFWADGIHWVVTDEAPRELQHKKQIKKQVAALEKQTQELGNTTPRVIVSSAPDCE